MLDSRCDAIDLSSRPHVEAMWLRNCAMDEEQTERLHYVPPCAVLSRPRLLPHPQCPRHLSNPNPNPNPNPDLSPNPDTGLRGGRASALDNGIAGAALGMIGVQQGPFRTP